MTVIKRDGREVPFDKDKIVKAVVKAFVDNDYSTDVAHPVAEKIADEVEATSKNLSVEEIQDTVEKKLMATKYKDIAKAYIEYRQLHKMARSQYKELMHAVAEKLQAKDVKNQNANVDEMSFGGRVGEASDIVTKQYALE